MVDYKKLTEEELRRLVDGGDNTAQEELDRRTKAREIKRARQTIDRVDEMIGRKVTFH